LQLVELKRGLPRIEVTWRSAHCGGSQHARRPEPRSVRGVRSVGRLVVMRAAVGARTHKADRMDGAAQRADRAGGVGITPIYWMPPRQWGRGGEVEGRRTKCGV
jgi:hypothetical protein